MSTHTPGPWSTDFDFDDLSFFRVFGEDVRDDDISPIFTVALVSRAFGSEAYANTRLIAAAPALLHALQHLQANPNDPRMHRQALDAISLACDR
jgi:hypothetical protein